jgi:very-short-patch-repair endonuclease
VGKPGIALEFRTNKEHHAGVSASFRPEIHRARQFRANMSDPEVMLWVRLRRLREHGFHFRRQAPFRGYFLDFVCFSRRLVVEVDGSQHGEDAQSEHDFVRDRVLTRAGFQVLRFWTSDVRYETDAVMDTIWHALSDAPLVRNGRVDHPDDLNRHRRAPP